MPPPASPTSAFALWATTSSSSSSASPTMYCPLSLGNSFPVTPTRRLGEGHGSGSQRPRASRPAASECRGTRLASCLLGSFYEKVRRDAGYSLHALGLVARLVSSRRGALPRGHHAWLPASSVSRGPDRGAGRSAADGARRPCRDPYGLSLQGRLALRRKGRLLRPHARKLSGHVDPQGTREDFEWPDRPSAGRLQRDDVDDPQEPPAQKDGEQRVRIGEQEGSGVRYAIKPKLGAVMRVVAAVLGKTPPDFECVIWTRDVPAFVRCDAPLRLDGPVYRIELAAPR